MSETEFPDRFPWSGFWLGLRIFIGLGLVGGFIGASIFRSAGWFIHDIYWLQEDLGGDKLTHVWMGAAVMAGALLLFGGFRLWWVAFGVVVFLLAEEFSQLFLETRSFSWADLGMGLLGAGFVAVIFGALRWWAGWWKGRSR